MSRESVVYSVNNLTVNEKKTLNESFSFDILKDWDFERNKQDFPTLDIRTIKPMSNKKAWWKCKNHPHSWQTSIRRRSEGFLCSYCSNKKLLQGFNDFSTKFPKLIEKWEQSKTNPDPKTVLYCTGKVEIQWPCEKGHFFTTTPALISKGRGCNYCQGTKVLKGFNDLASKCPDSTEWWDYEKNSKTPEDVRYGSDVKVWWKCPLGHNYQASINHFRHGRRCSICAGKTVDATTQLSITHPHLEREWDYSRNDKTPQDISVGHDKKVWWICEKCDHHWEAYVYNRTNKKRPQGCPKCAKGITSSRGEKQIIEFLLENGLTQNDISTHEIIFSEEFDNKIEIDIFIPKLNIGIEFNGVYYHSEKFVDKDYHYRKFKICQDKNIQLIQIWEDDWYSKQEIIQQLLLHKLNLRKDLRIYARNTIVKEISHSEAFAFLNNHHIQGSANSSLYVGLLSKETERIVSVMSIKYEDSKRNFNITRYATSHHVIGGFTKIIKYLEREYSPNSFTTFSDNCISNGELYFANGFSKDRELNPDYMYLIKKSHREHKFKYRKIKFKNDPRLLWKEGLTERQLAGLNGMLRIYDAGKVKWIKQVE